MLGNSSVGKTNIINVYTGNEFSANTSVTIGLIFN